MASTFLVPRDGVDIVNGGDDVDVVSYLFTSVPVNANLNTGQTTATDGNDTLTDLENLVGTNGQDTLVGDDGENVINGEGGPDFILGNGGADSLHGGPGNDTIHSGEGADELFGKADDDALDGGDGPDQLSGGTGIDTVSFLSSNGAVVSLATGANNQGDTLINNGTDKFENLTGGSGADTLTGDAGGNVLDGFKGDDTLRGGGGADSYVGDIGSPQSTTRVQIRSRLTSVMGRTTRAILFQGSKMSSVPPGRIL
ncbi:MAG: calcium-binding protein [Dehalococcoidia bacterium]